MEDDFSDLAAWARGACMASIGRRAQEQEDVSIHDSCFLQRLPYFSWNIKPKWLNYTTKTAIEVPKWGKYTKNDNV
jgi:hypothetical protein